MGFKLQIPRLILLRRSLPGINNSKMRPVGQLEHIVINKAISHGSVSDHFVNIWQNVYSGKIWNYYRCFLSPWVAQVICWRYRKTKRTWRKWHSVTNDIIAQFVTIGLYWALLVIRQWLLVWFLLTAWMKLLTAKSFCNYSKLWDSINSGCWWRNRTENRQQSVSWINCEISFIYLPHDRHFCH